MKIGPSQLAGVVREPSRFVGILLHGSDAGLIREQALALTSSVVGQANDPFLTCVLTKERHGGLGEEASSFGFGGGRRVIRVVDSGDTITATVGRLKPAADAAFIILEAGGLTAKSKLRRFAEETGHWASLACQPDTGAQLAASIRRFFVEANFTITDDVVEFLARELEHDTTTRRSELSKLALFAAGQSTIGLEDAYACAASRAESGIDLILAAVMRGDLEMVSRCLEELIEGSATGAGLVVALSNRAHRVLSVRLKIDGGSNADLAVRSLVPPVFFRDMKRVTEEARRWPSQALMAVLGDARQADLACKRAGARDVAIASQLLLSVTRRATRRMIPS